ncbi:BolA family protein [Buchnera aphidicola]|uniref:BolA/IbaG family iron-sulfur metabolism protein n=1 Tax=Buchnera aphidicola subsp. Uroleucon sonchi TaxID=118118 RepID=A0A6C1FDG5_BUCUN|nr:BolA/IbaG family iron-sulfur metabolism protein [Buchnera aphidicola]QIE02156.1 BolA/IbaG family iron-sulfur metabolism protein [Buchnera aphidicola (Uroleucon sonchi)]
MIVKKIKQCLKSTINTNFIKIYNNSRFHHHSVQDLTHIKIIIISNDFINQNIIDRHRLIFSKLFKIKKIYSLTLHAYTVSEWKDKRCLINNDPKCYKK